MEHNWALLAKGGFKILSNATDIDKGHSDLH